MTGAGVEQGGGGGQVVEPVHQAVQGGHFLQGPLGGVLGQPGGDAQHEVLRGLGDLAGERVPQQVPAVQCPQPEVAEAVVRAVGEGPVDQGVECGGVQGDELGRTVRDQALAVPDGDRGREGDGALSGGLVRDGPGEEPGGEPRVGRVLRDQAGGGLGGQRAQFRLVRPRAAAAQGGGGDPSGVGVGEIGGEAGQGPQQGGPGRVGRTAFGFRG